MTRSYEKACKAMQKTPVNPIGTCFDSVARNVLLNEELPESAIICHGIGLTNMPEETPEIMAHAWIEYIDEDGILLAADTTWDVVALAEDYRTKASLHYVKTYTPEEFMVNWDDFGFPGPWDNKILKVIKSYS